MALEGTVLSLWRRDSTGLQDAANPSGVFGRKRIETATLDPSGIVDSFEWHTTQDNAEEIAKAGGDVNDPATTGERGVLVQTPAHIEQLCRDFPEFAESLSAEAAWGENAVVDGLSCGTVCVGDVFHVFGPGGERRGGAVLEASSPRRPCGNVDKRHGQRYNQQGVRPFSAPAPAPARAPAADPSDVRAGAGARAHGADGAGRHLPPRDHSRHHRRGRHAPPRRPTPPRLDPGEGGPPPLLGGGGREV